MIALAISLSLTLAGCGRSRVDAPVQAASGGSGGNAGSSQAAGAAGELGSGCGRPNCPIILYGARPGYLSRGVEVDTNDVYWGETTNEDGLLVRAAPKTGAGPVRTLGSWHDFSAGRSLVVDDRHAYWLRPDEGGVLVRVDKDGANARNTALPAPSDGRKATLGPLEDAGDAVIVAAHGCTHIYRAPKDGSVPTAFPVSTAQPAGGETGLAHDGAFIYCSNGKRIHRLDPRTGKSEPLTSDLDMAGPLLVRNGQLFVGNNRPAIGTGENLAVIALDTAATNDLGPTGGYVSRLLFDEKRRTVYWVTGLSRTLGKVAAYRLDGSAAPDILFENQDVMGNSAADTDYVYWVSDRAVTRLRKSP